MLLLAVILSLVLLGMLVSYIVNREKWPVSTIEDGRRPAQVRLTWGVSIVVAAWIVSLLAYQLDSDLMIEGVKNNFRRDVLFFIGILLFPSAYLLGVELERSTRHSAFPPLANPIALPDNGSIIVIADTHLGLRPNFIADLWDIGSDCDLHAIGTFIDWLVEETGKDATDAGQEISRWDGADGSGGQVKPKTLLRPRYVVLLGDILEMWDGWQESVQLAISTTFSKFNRIDPDTEVVYVVGNHDQVHVWDRTPDLHTRDDSPESDEKVEKDVRVAADSWPGPTNPWGTRMRPIKAGDSEYLFVHGHQFGWWYMFAAPLMFLPGLFRRAAQLGYYTWFVLLLAAGVFWFRGVFEDFKAVEIFIYFLALFLLVPIIWITFARLFFSGVRYRNDKGLWYFGSWWKRVAGGPIDPDRKDKRLNLVYGHTHMMDIINEHDEGKLITKKDRRTKKVKITKKRKYPWINDLRTNHIMPQLFNLPSWIRDRRKSMDRAIFLYIDKDHHLFLGWDWRAKRPFHIPDALIQGRTETDEGGLRPPEVGITDKQLLDLNWPRKYRMNQVDWRPPPEED